MLFGLLLTLGVGVLSVALRSYQTSFAQKAGALGILIASFLAVYFITGSMAWGIAGAASWLFLPWLEILTRIRTLRLPKEKQLRPRAPLRPASSLGWMISAGKSRTRASLMLLMPVGTGKITGNSSGFSTKGMIGPRPPSA